MTASKQVSGSRNPRGSDDVGQARSDLIGESPAFLRAVAEAERVAGFNVPVLLQAETGSGKELFSRFIHRCSPRRDEPLVSVNCASMPPDLMENEFFGHRKGAFTNAVGDRQGYVGEAHLGTLFLDEIASLDFRLQAKLLRFLQNGEYRPLGATSHRYADVRIIAATNVALEEQVEARRFRRDLFFRLGVFVLEIPSLRERREDIPLLTDYFLLRYARKFGVGRPQLSTSGYEELTAYLWPGNVRELQNVAQRLVIRHPGERVPTVRTLLNSNRLAPVRAYPPTSTFQEAKRRVIREFEVEYLHNLLRRHAGNVSRAARASGKHRRALTELLRKHGIDANSYRRGSTRPAET